MFSYADYKEIVIAIKKKGNGCFFHEAIGKDNFTLMRHDVEFSVKRAFELALFEQSLDFRSTYFFQLTNNTYNVLSQINRDYLREIHDMGHKVGLHFHMNCITNLEEMEKEILLELDTMQQYVGYQFDVFSIHRPNAQILSANIKLPSVLNAYQDDFFSYVEDMENEIPEITYVSDARHQWNYGLVPDEKLIAEKDKLQILTHPYSWTERGYNNKDNFFLLLQEKKTELMESINSECKHFEEVKNEL